jgi:hypothetical protein
MLLPENPERKPSLWDSVEKQLAQEAMCFIVKEGVGNPLAEANEPSKDVAELTLSRLRESQICRVSANHGRAVSPHFAGRREGDTVLLTEFLSYPSEDALTVDNGKLKRDLETAVINLFFTGGGISTVLVPLQLAPWATQEAEISLTREGLAFRKKL